VTIYTDILNFGGSYLSCREANTSHRPTFEHGPNAVTVLTGYGPVTTVEPCWLCVLLVCSGSAAERSVKL
jgi:hypothetical protein